MERVIRIDRRESSWPVVASSAVRVIFGIIWAIDAWLKWQPAFAEHYVGYLQNAAAAQPDWLQPWFTFWLSLIGPNPAPYILATRVVETIIAIGLLLGLARASVYVLGALFSPLIWS